MEIDDSVKVKNGILCPDLKELCIWGWQGRISEIAEDDEMEALKAWEKYLEKTLSFPFDAIITESTGRRQLKMGDKVRVERISYVEELHGINVELSMGRNKYDHPLCDMKVASG